MGLGTPIRVVIADDEPITKMDLNELLSEAGYEVVGEASDYHVISEFIIYQV